MKGNGRKFSPCDYCLAKVYDGVYVEANLIVFDPILFADVPSPILLTDIDMRFFFPFASHLSLRICFSNDST